MIYPTQRAVFAMALGMPLALGVSLLRPHLWPVGAAWVALVVALMIVDFLMAANRAKLTVSMKPPPVLFIDDKETLRVDVDFSAGPAPSFLDVKLATNAYVKATPSFQRVTEFDPEHGFATAFNLTTARRGDGRLEALWIRWRGPFGLIWKQKTHKIDADVPVVPNIKYVTQNALKFFSRDAAFGQKIQRDRGEGSEFDSLREFVSGMDKRAIDWKHSARHRVLQAKEFRTERNHNIIFALDTGRLMCEPLKGIPRVDRALNAALLMAFVSLKIGDRVGIFGFDARPHVYAKPVTGLGAFPSLQKQSAKIEYSIEETNFTLGLTQLGRTLSRRSLIVIFTDFVDTTNAELMLENVGRLVKKHLVLFVAFKDVVLDSYMDAPPNTPDDVSRAVIAASLSKDREIVMAKLRRMGVQIVEADIDTVGTDVLNKFFDLKRREML